MANAESEKARMAAMAQQERVHNEAQESMRDFEKRAQAQIMAQERAALNGASGRNGELWYILQKHRGRRGEFCWGYWHHSGVVPLLEKGGLDRPQREVGVRSSSQERGSEMTA